jgi:ABC-2 type transport system permease protein
MRTTWAVCKREFSSYFLTPVGYVSAGMVAVLSGLGFTLSFISYAIMSQSPREYGFNAVPDFEETLLSPFLVFCGMLIMFLSPLITMGLFAKERNRGTIELLLTYPLRDRDLILGKYFAAMGMVLVLMLFVAVDVAIVGYFVEIEAAVLVFGVLTVFLMGAAFVSLGLFVSSLTHNQVTAGTLTFGLLLLLYFVGSVGEYLPEVNPAPVVWPEMARNGVGAVYDVFRAFVLEMNLDAHAKEMAQGVVQPKDMAYYPLFAIFFLFLTFRVLESRNWRRS